MGIFLTILGINNVGKTTQQKLLEERLIAERYTVAHVKYPKYDLAPTGPRINAYLREGNPEGLSSEEFHSLLIENRTDFAQELDRLIDTHDVVIAEMYVGTGIAYAMGDGLDKDMLIDRNAHLRPADISILLDGKRFLEAREMNHHYENDDEKSEQIRLGHLELANDFGWHILDANKTISEVHEDIYAILAKELTQ